MPTRFQFECKIWPESMGFGGAPCSFHTVLTCVSIILGLGTPGNQLQNPWAIMVAFAWRKGCLPLPQMHWYALMAPSVRKSETSFDPACARWGLRTIAKLTHITWSTSVFWEMIIVKGFINQLTTGGPQRNYGNLQGDHRKWWGNHAKLRQNRLIEEIFTRNSETHT